MHICKDFLEQAMGGASRAQSNAPDFGDEQRRAAAHQLAWGMMDWYRADPRRAAVFGDAGQMLTVAAGFGCQNENGVTIATITRIVRAANFASARRVRALIDNLRRLGIVEGVFGGDARARPMRFGGWLEAALLDWLSLRIAILKPWLPNEVAPSAQLLRTTLGKAVEGIASGVISTAGWPELRFFLDHKAGYPMLLELMGGSPGGCIDVPFNVVSRKWLSQFYGISRPHVTELLREAEARGWLTVTTDLSESFLSSRSRNRLEHWFAQEIGWTADELGFRPSSDREKAAV